MGQAETYVVGGTDSRLTEFRLGWLLHENRRIAQEQVLYRTDRERLEAETVKRPVKIEQAFRTFGFMLGSIPPASIVFKAALSSNRFDPETVGFAMLIIIAGLLTGLAGYWSGNLVATTVRRADKFSIPNRAALIAFVGMTWGIACGAAGGLAIFLIGAIPAAFIGGVAAAVALPIFSILLNYARRGDRIALGHFLPISLGIVLSIAGFVLGL